MRNGMTLMSVMVAVALAGIVALAVARLLGNQSKTMTVIRLREQREELLKHYKNVVVSGWDSTRSTCSGNVCARNGDIIIPTSGTLYLAEDLYDYNYTGGTANHWWKVTANRVGVSSGSVLQADSYVKSESLMAVEVRVEFIPKEHPVVKTRLAPREEIVFLHHNTDSALPSNSTQCLGGHLTQKYDSGDPIYSGAGAIIQYDFNSNYTKCSQVPLVKNEDCAKGALLGFLRTQKTGTLKEQLIIGDPICSTRDYGDDIAQVRGSNSSQRGASGTEKRTVEAIDCDGSGYIEWMKNDEKPRCVTGAAPGASIKRVAGESKFAPSGSQTFNLVHKVSDTAAGDCRSRSAREGPPYYANFTCDVPRYEGIEKFDDRGEIKTNYVKYYDDFSEIGPAGPCGPTGPTGDYNAPPGPQGQQKCPGCCKMCYYTCCSSWTDALGNSHCSCTTCSTRVLCNGSCPANQSC